MKRKRLDRDIWTSITAKRYTQRQVDGGDFSGIISLLHIDDVSNVSQWEYPDKVITVCDKGMKWLQIMPADENYLITAMISREDRINIWYIDIIADQGFADDHVAYYDDLYLDLIVRPDGNVKTDDMDELMEALEEGGITRELFDLALRTKEKIEKQLLNDLPKLNDFCIRAMRDLENRDDIMCLK